MNGHFYRNLYFAAMTAFRLLYLLLLPAIFACKPKYDNPHVLIETSQGDIEVELYPAKAPLSAGAFLRHVKQGLYNNSSFYRVLSDENQVTGQPKSELVQGGVWRTGQNRDTIQPVPHENTRQTGLSHVNGTVSFARVEPGSASTEFFICIGNQPGFDHGGRNNPDGQGYAAFGRVVAGMDVVNRIYRQPETDQYFDPPVKIKTIREL